MGHKGMMLQFLPLASLVSGFDLSVCSRRVLIQLWSGSGGYDSGLGCRVGLSL